MKYILWLLLLGIHTVQNAQQSADSLQIKQVEVVKAFEASIATVSKVDVKPQEAITERKLPSYTYTMSHQPIAVSDPVPVIKPLAMEADPPFKIHNGYVQASYGYRQNPEIEAGYHVMQKEAFNAGVRAYYASLDNSSRQPWQKFRTMGATLYGQKLISENIQLFGDVQSDFQRRYFYHTSVISDTLQSGSLERQRNDLGFKLGFRNAEETKTGIHYESGIGIKRLTLVNENVAEWSFSISAKMHKNFSDKFQFKAHAQIDNTHLKTETSFSQTIVQVTPAVKVNYSKFSTEVGVQYLSSGPGNSYIFPVGAIHVPIKSPYLVIIGEVSQGNFANTLRNASGLNPFVQNVVDSLVNTVSRNISLGVKGMTSSLAYRIKLGRQTLEDQMFFVNQPNDVRKFKMIYDSGVQWYVTGVFEKNFDEQFLLGSQITLNQYKLDNLPRAWHIPRFEGSFYVKTNMLSEKLGLRGDFIYNSFSYYPDEKSIRRTNALMDVSISGNYKLGNKITALASIQNMLNNRFERWYGYPTIGINASIGIKVLF